MKYAIVILAISMVACNLGRKRGTDLSKELFFPAIDTLVLDTSIGVRVPDSVILQLYLCGKFEDIVVGGYCLNSQLKKGLYSASLSNLSRYEEARKYLSDVDKIGVKLTEEDIRMPVFNVEKVNFYSFLSLYKYVSLSGSYNDDELRTIVHLNYNKAIDVRSDPKAVYLMTLEGIVTSGLSVKNIPENRATLTDLNSLKPQFVEFPGFQFVRTQLQYLVDSNLVSYTEKLKELNEIGFQEEYNMRLLMRRYLQSEIVDSTKMDSLWREYDRRYPRYCNTISIYHKYFTLKSYDSSLYKECMKCTESNAQKNVIYGNVFLGYYYLRNRKFTKVDSLVALYRNESAYSSGAFRSWELTEYYAMEMAGHFLRKDFDKFKDVAYHLGYNDRFRTDYKDNEEAYKKLVKYFYKWYVNEDLQGYNAFVTKYNLY